jgi:hypothetical protein
MAVKALESDGPAPVPHSGQHIEPRRSDEQRSVDRRRRIIVRGAGLGHRHSGPAMRALGAVAQVATGWHGASVPCLPKTPAGRGAAWRNRETDERRIALIQEAASAAVADAQYPKRPGFGIALRKNEGR